MSDDQDRETIERLTTGVSNFQAEMREKNIHLGMPNRSGAVVCVTCREPWPCSGGKS